MFKKYKSHTHDQDQLNGVSLISFFKPQSPITEQFRTIRTNLQFVATKDHPLYSMMLTSPSLGEGKSTVAANLAIVFAQAAQQVLLVDADMRRSTVHRTFNVNNQMGLSNLLVDQVSLTDCIQETKIPNLSLITSGFRPPNPAELLNSNNLQHLVQQMETKFDLVIFDAPPVLAVTDAQILSRQVTGSLLVVRPGMTTKKSLMQAQETLNLVHSTIFGVICNDYAMQTQSGYYYG